MIKFVGCVVFLMRLQAVEICYNRYQCGPMLPGNKVPRPAQLRCRSFRFPCACCPVAHQVAAPAQESSSETSSEIPSEHASTAEWGAVFALIGPAGNASSFSYNASDWAEAPFLYNSSDGSSSSSGSFAVGEENTCFFVVKESKQWSIAV